MKWSNPSPLIRLIFGLFFIACLALGFNHFQDTLSFGYLQRHHELALTFYHQKPALTLIIFFIGYTIYASLGLPGINLIMLLTGAVFGFWMGLWVTAIASAIGATMVFIWSRYFFRDWLQQKYFSKVESLNAHIKQHGAYYVVISHLIAGIPSSLINLLFGLTPLPWYKFFLAMLVAQLLNATLFNYFGQLLGHAVTASSIKAEPLLLVLPLLMILSPLFVGWLKSGSTENS